MNTTRNGKIARLPKAIREELNRRLENGEEGKVLVEWLNSLPEVDSASPIREQNLSEWRHGGYRDWQIQQETLDIARQMAADTEELQPAGGGQILTDQVAVWLTARYLMAIRKLGGLNPDGEPDFKLLRELCQDVVALRRGDHSAVRLKMEQERLEREREETEAQAVEHFKRWANHPKVREAICGECCSAEEKEARMRAIFGLAQAPAENGATAGDAAAEPLPPAK